MSYNLLYGLWAFAFVLTAGLGFIPNPEGAALVILRCISLLFFLPPALILVKAKKEDARRQTLLVNRLSIASLACTCLLLVASVLSAGGSEALGTILHILLTIISAPMECSNFYALSLFGWACLMMASFPEKKKKTKE